MTTQQQEESDGIPLDVDAGLRLPIVDVLTGRGFITGKSGSGKSNTASVIAEELLDRGFPVLIVDTDGEYWGLKEEYEILHVGADEDCDLVVGPEHAGKLAELALEDNVPIILDVSGYLDESDALDLIRATARELFTREKKLGKPFLILVEEIHEYIPEGGGLDETGEMLIRVAKRGRKRGLGITGMSQRPANVKKDYITQCDWIVWHRLTWENDTDVVRSVIGRPYDEEVQELADGEGLLMADFIDADPVDRVQIRRKHTFDAGETPDLGEFERPDLIDVGGDLVSELEEITEREEHRQDRIAQLEAEVASREEEIEALEADLERARDMQDMAQEFTDALTSSAGGDADALQERVEEIREEKQAEIRSLQAERDDLEAENERLREEVAGLGERVDALERYEQAIENIDELEEAVVRMNEALGLDTEGVDAEKYQRKLESRDERVAELEETVRRLREEGYTLDEEFQSKLDFLKHDAVQEEVVRAADKTTYKEEHAWDALSILVDRDRATMDDIAPFVDISRSSVSSVLSKLQDHNVVKKDRRGNDTYYELNVDGMKEIVQQRRKREEMEDLKTNVKETVR